MYLMNSFLQELEAENQQLMDEVSKLSEQVMKIEQLKDSLSTENTNYRKQLDDCTREMEVYFFLFNVSMRRHVIRDQVCTRDPLVA